MLCPYTCCSTDGPGGWLRPTLVAQDFIPVAQDAFVRRSGTSSPAKADFILRSSDRPSQAIRAGGSRLLPMAGGGGANARGAAHSGAAVAIHLDLRASRADDSGRP